MGRTFEDAVRARAFQISQGPDAATPPGDWARAERDLLVAWDYDTADRDLERFGMTLSRLPSEAGVVWRLHLPRGERVEEWEPGNDGLTPPEPVARLIAAVAAGKPLEPAPPVPTDRGARRLRELLDVQRQELLLHDPGVRVGVDPENLHNHRVAARRAREFLRAARASLDADWRRSLSRRLAELGAATGPVRDADVLLEHVEKELGFVPDADRAAGPLLVALIERRREESRRQLLAALDGDSYRRLLVRLRVPPRLAAGVDAVPLKRVVRNEVARLADAVAALGPDPDDASLHRLRIVLKRVRYVAELAAPEGKARRRFLAHARALQDVLGEHQDAVAAEELLRAVVVGDGSTAAAFLAGRLAERQLHRRRRVREELPAVWKRVRKSAARLR